MNSTQACKLIVSLILIYFGWISIIQPSSLAQPAKDSTRLGSPQKTKREQIKEKIMELKLQLEKTPNRQNTLIRLSQSLLALELYQEALTHLRTVTNAAPQYADGHFYTAFTLRKLKRYREAIEEYEVFLSLVEGDKRLSGIFGLAKSLDLIGDPRGALERYEEFVDGEKRASQRRYVDEAKASIRRLQASEVVLIDTDSRDEPPEILKEEQQKQTQPLESLSIVLDKADRFFSDRNYKEASDLYESLSQRELPQNIILQTTYSAAVSKYLLGDFKAAKQLAESGLMLDDQSDVLRGLAVLSHIQYKQTQPSTTHNHQEFLSVVRIALKEGRLRDCLKMINDYLMQQKDSISPLLLHAKGRALLGLNRNTEAYQVLRSASKGLRYPHLHLDLALTAQRLNKPKLVRKHYNDLKRQTSPQRGEKPSALHRLALSALQGQ